MKIYNSRIYIRCNWNMKHKCVCVCVYTIYKRIPLFGLDFYVVQKCPYSLF